MSSFEASPSASSPPMPPPPELPEAMCDRPTACIVVGMAGSGKTTLMQRLNHYAVERLEAAAAEGVTSDKPTYYVNLDPAVKTVPFAAGIDIRDTVDYKAVMKQYNLGPNGAIMTSLNLFATRFDQVLDIVERRAAEGLKHVFFDTPGQIEVFTWSASGMIITETLALKFPTVLLYVVDTPRTTNPTTFMSNMLYACSMLYKTNLPLVLVFNKTDVASADFAMEWMNDFEKFQEALDEARNQTYMTSLNRSMGLVLDEFYRNLRAVAVSAATGEGIPELMQALTDAAAEYETNYLPELERRKAIAGQKEAKRQEKDIESLMKDVAIDKERQAAAAATKANGGSRGGNGGGSGDTSGGAAAMDLGGAASDATGGSGAMPVSTGSRAPRASVEDVDMAATVHRGKAPAVGSARPQPSPALPTGASGGSVGPGSKVELHGLVAKPELNGKQGIVMAAGEGAAEGRWAVRVEGAAASAKPLAFKPDNLRLLA